MIQYQAYLERREAARKTERDEQVRREARMKAFDAMIDTSLGRGAPEEHPAEEERAEGEPENPSSESADPFGPRWA
jgi:hypothetical protein